MDTVVNKCRASGKKKEKLLKLLHMIKNPRATLSQLLFLSFPCFSFSELPFYPFHLLPFLNGNQHHILQWQTLKNWDVE